MSVVSERGSPSHHSSQPAQPEAYAPPLGAVEHIHLPCQPHHQTRPVLGLPLRSWTFHHTNFGVESYQLVVVSCPRSK